MEKLSRISYLLSCLFTGASSSLFYVFKSKWPYTQTHPPSDIQYDLLINKNRMIKWIIVPTFFFCNQSFKLKAYSEMFLSLE